MNIDSLSKYSISDAVNFNDDLNPQLWDSNQRLLPQIRKQLIRIAEDFQEFLGISSLNVVDITFSGSNAGYTYTSKSDIDLHLVVEMPDLKYSDVFMELFHAKKTQYNAEFTVKIKGHDVELYVQDADKAHISQGIYSVANDKWISVPKKIKAKPDDFSTKAKYDSTLEWATTALKSDDGSQIEAALNRIYTLRRAGLEQGGELSPENLAFKLLRNYGIIDELQNARKKFHGAKLSLEDKTPEEYGWFGEADDNALLDKPTPSPREIAKRHNVSLSSVFSALKKGIKVESEHTSIKSVAREIALDHLAERPDYYDRLAMVESVSSPSDIAAAFRAEARTRWPNATIDLYAGSPKNSLIISKIAVPKEHRKLGIATDIMKQVSSLADKHGLRVILTPSGDFGASKNRLIEFYKRFGFVMNHGRFKDYEVSELMYREPKPRLAEAVGRITPQNTTADVGLDAVKKQAKKFGNDVDIDGYPSKKMRSNGVVESMAASLLDEYNALNEINMSPGSLTTWSAKGGTTNITMGFEAELIFDREGGVDEDAEIEHDLSMDRKTTGIDDIVEFFEGSATYIDMIVRKLERAFKEFLFGRDAAIDDYEEELNRYLEAKIESEWDNESGPMAYEVMINNGVSDSDAYSAVRDPSSELFKQFIPKTKEKLAYAYKEQLDDLTKYLQENEPRVYNALWSDFAYKARIAMMSDVSDKFGFDWPYQLEQESAKYWNYYAAEKLAGEMRLDLDYGIRVQDTPQKDKLPNTWYIEPDGSVNADPDANVGLPVEIVSPPMPFNQAIKEMSRLLNWASDNDAYTNSTTGIHISMSVNEKTMADMDYLKLVLLVGDEYVLDIFERLGNSYCRSIIPIIDKHSQTLQSRELIADAITKLRQGLESAASKAVLAKNPGKYYSVNVHSNYVEFRSAGGDYIKRIDDLTVVATRYARALSAAHNPMDSREEYLKKLYKLIMNVVGPQYSDSVHLFVNYTVYGDKAALVNSLKQKKQQIPQITDSMKYINVAEPIIMNALTTFKIDNEAAIARNKIRLADTRQKPNQSLGHAKDIIRFIVGDLFGQGAAPRTEKVIMQLIDDAFVEAGGRI